MDDVRPPSAQTLQSLRQLYQNIDNQVEKLIRIHGARLHCGRGCSACCVDEISVFPVEACVIRSFHARLLKHAYPHPKGACAFLDGKGACRIYNHRPYVCRTQGLPLHWIERYDNGKIVAMRDICPLNEKGTPIEQLPEDKCWKIGPMEEALARVQYRADKKKIKRVPLRNLFRVSKLFA